MITSLAVDREFAYTLDAGVITRHQLTARQNVDTYTGPGIGTVTQLMTTNEAVYVLTDEGLAFSRDNDGESWAPVPIPAGVDQLSSDDGFLYALISGDLYQQDRETGPFIHVPDSIGVNDIAQVDHDEEFGYVLLNSGDIWIRKTPDGEWFQFPQLYGALQVVAGLDFIYARTSSGNVYRSRTYDRSKWESMEVQSVELLAVASDHTDKLWFIRRDVLQSVSVLDFVSTGTFKDPEETAWIDADWIDEDWIEVA